jgi:hypothetical protein
MSLLKQWIPTWMKGWRRRGAGVLYRSANQNIYHCTVQKSASQWLCGLLSDPRIQRYSGLTSHPGGDGKKITERAHLDIFPAATIVTPIYTDFAGFTAIPKPVRYKAFFVMRDPRDVLVSWYFSLKYSHPADTEVERVRQVLLRLNDSQGLLYSLDFLRDFGLFHAQRSWAGAQAKDANVLLTRFEDLVAPDNLAAVAKLLRHCDIRLPPNVLEELLRSHSFEELSGRKRGEEDRAAHYRKGVAGDWRNHLDEPIRARFNAVAGDLIELWNYPRV